MRRLLIPMLTAAIVAVAPALARADSNEYVRFHTSLGNIDVELLPTAAPNTVKNFLGYVNSGAYNATFFHRSVSNFVIQGGGYYVANGQVNQIPASAPVANEYSVPNTAGTLAMATASDQPDSATNEWFFNTVDNSSGLGPGSPHNTKGYTVFAKVLDPASLNVMEATAAVMPQDESATWGSQAFAALPLLNYTSGQPPTIQNLVMSPITVLSGAAPPVITITQPADDVQYLQGQRLTPQFSCGEGAGTAIQTCSGPTVVDTSVVGQHSFSVVATDYSGNTSTQTVQFGVAAAPKPKPTPTPKPTAPKLSGSLTTPSSGRLVVKLNCSVSLKCTGNATLYALGLAKHGKRIQLGEARYSFAAHKQGKLTLRLGHSVLTLLRHHRNRLNVALVLAPRGGRTHTVDTHLRLRRA